MIKTINISLTDELLARIDVNCKALYSSRSEYIRHAVIEQLRLDSGADERKALVRRTPIKYLESTLDDGYAFKEGYDLFP